MKIAYHFNINDTITADSIYSVRVLRTIFSIILRHRKLNISTKVFIGDLLIHFLAMDTKTTETESGKGLSKTFNEEKYAKIFEMWISSDGRKWFSQESVRKAYGAEMFTVCFENIDFQLAEYLHSHLLNYSPYIGAIEVDETSNIHWELYSQCLSSRFRIINKSLNIFWDGINEESKDISWIESMSSLGFQKIGFESLEGRYTIFDKYHNFEHARRVAEWKKQCGNFLAYISDDVITRIGDSAPELGNKFWATFKTFEEAETNEQLAQVTTSCRRIIEYVVDCIFPPTEDTHNGHKLGQAQYKNRLLAFADIKRKSDTNIDVIVASTNMLNEQIEKLISLVNKGVHSEVYRNETRRCLIRTIMLLDDILSLKCDPFPIVTEFDFDDFMNRISD